MLPSVIWVIQYVGNIAWHQNIVNNINNANPNIGVVNIGTAASPTYLDARQVSGDGGGKYGSDASSSFGNLGGFNAFRQYQGYTGISQDQNQTNGSYNGFQTGLRVQNRWGLSGEIDYTYSHEIDITSYDRTTVTILGTSSMTRVLASWIAGTSSAPTTSTSSHRHQEHWHRQVSCRRMGDCRNHR